MENKVQKILLVEDDYRLAMEWKNQLINKGFDVDNASNSEEALLLLENNYDCFIIDLFNVKHGEFLPNGGIKAIAAIRRYGDSYGKPSTIIAITGYYRHGGDCVLSTGEIVKNLGADYAFEKPIELSKIIAVIE
ncbi:MAG: response regulator [Saprospiraceae bacterium]